MFNLSNLWALVIASIDTYIRIILVSGTAYIIVSVCYYIVLKSHVDMPKWCHNVALLSPEEQCKYLRHFEILHKKELTTIEFPIGIEQYLAFAAIEEEYYDIINKIDERISRINSDFNDMVKKRIEFLKEENHDLLNIKNEINDIILPVVENHINSDHKNIFTHESHSFIVWFPKHPHNIRYIPHIMNLYDDDGLIKFQLPLNAEQLYHIEQDLNV